ncbi:TLDc domain-containing protein [Entamoeba marina]
MQSKFNAINQYITTLEKRRENETAYCTANKIIYLVKDVTQALQDMYSEFCSTTQQLQQQIQSIGTVQPQKVIEEVVVEEELEPNSKLPISYVNQLKEWTTLKTFKVMYDGGVPTTKQFNQIVGGHYNITLVITTTDEAVFGTFSSKMRSPNSPRDNDFDYENDNEFFVFSLENNQKIPPQKFLKKNTSYTMARFASNNELMVVEAESCFKMANKDGVSYVSKYFQSDYTNTENITAEIFVKDKATETFVVKRLLVLEWK